MYHKTKTKKNPQKRITSSLRRLGTAQVNFHIFFSLAVKELRAVAVSSRLKSLV
jgi:hypothetical protein